MLPLCLYVGCGQGPDRDGDGFVDAGQGGLDCDDLDGTVSPSHQERCGDGVDNDCDGVVDDAGIGESVWYLDEDGDEYGVESEAVAACEPESSEYVDRFGDCDDTRTDTHPEADDLVGDGDDQNCDDVDGIDDDGDGAASEGSGGSDCDDTNAAISPSAQDIVGDGVDDNCDDVDGVDADIDGWASLASGGDDCDDKTDLIHPEAVETPYDGVDQDCVDGDLVDVDGDGEVAVEAGGLDCADDDPNRLTTAADTVGDGVDQNCDELDGVDADGDGHASEASGGSDCDDQRPDVYAGGVEVLVDGVDQDCDGSDDTSFVFLTDELQINTTTQGAQHHATAVFGDDLEWLVLFISGDLAVESEAHSVLMDGAGNPLTGETLIGTPDVRPPQVLRDGGRFLATWGELNNWDLWLAEIDLDGGFVASEVVYTGVTAEADYPDLAVGLTGDITVVFNEIDGLGSRFRGITASPSFVAVGEAFDIDTSLTGGPLNVVTRSDGTSLVVWNTGEPGVATEIRMQAFDPEGLAVDGPILVDSSVLELGRPEVDNHDDGRLVVTWRAQTEDKDGLGAWYRLYDDQLAPISSSLPISGSGEENRPTVTSFGDVFVLSWEEADPDGVGVFLRVHRWSDGAAISDVIEVNTTTGGNQMRSDVALTVFDGWLEGVVTWEAFQFDGDARGVAARRFRVGMVGP